MVCQKGNKLDNSQIAGNDINYNNYTYLQNIDIGNVLLREVPKLDKEYIEREIECIVSNAITKADVIQIFGISGCGKTELIKSVVSKQMDGFKNIYWISCEKTKEVHLEEVHELSGQEFDILNQIKHERCLVILDNAFMRIMQVVDSFRKVDNHNSKLIIISQEKSLYRGITEKIQVKFMSKGEAKQLFTEDIFQNKDFKELFEKIDYHPLMMKLLKTYLLDEDNGIFVSDFTNTKRLVELKDSELTKSEEICEKILGDYYIKKPDICSLLAILGNNQIEAEFLKYCIVSDIPDMVKRGFLSAEEGYYSIHDIVLNSMGALVQNNCDIVKLPYVSKIKEYLEQGNENRTLPFYTFYALHQNFLTYIYKTYENKELQILIYNSILLFANHKNRVEHIKNIDNLLEGNSLASYYSIKLLIEKLEYQIQLCKVERLEQIERAITILFELLEKKQDLECELLIKSHMGKFYNWNQNYKEAESFFIDVLNQKKNEPSVTLQLLRIYRQYITENRKKTDSRQKEDELQCKVSNMLKGLSYENIPVAIYLEIVNLIKNQPLNSDENLKLCLWNQFDYFKKVVTLYAQTSVFQHIYSTVGELSETLSYNKPDFFDEWFHKVNHPIDNEKMQKSVIKIFCAEIKICGQKEVDYKNYLHSLQECWKREKEGNVKAFDYNVIIKMYLAIGEYSKAQIELEEIYDEKNEWHLKFKSQIERGNENYREALQNIELAIKLYRGKSRNDTKYAFAFLKDKAEILYILGDESYKDIMLEAISGTTDENLKREWETLLTSWANK